MSQNANLLFEQNQPLIWTAVNKFKNIPYDLLVNTCLIGLWQACQKFTDGRGQFSTFAVKCMVNEVLMLLRKEFANKIETISFDDIDYWLIPESEIHVETTDEYKIVKKEFGLQLKGIQHKIFRMKYQGYTQMEIAKKLKVSRQYIGQQMKKIREQNKEIKNGIIYQ